MRRLHVAILMVLLGLCLSVPALAASSVAIDAAEQLHSLGLLQGAGTNADGSINYDLDSAMTRDAGITMLVRMLGKENDAKAGKWNHPFSDIPTWLEPYVGYAYANKLTDGVGNVDGKPVYGAKNNMTATQYLTFVLRSLGYKSGADFQWDKAWELTDKLGITHGEYSEKNNDRFTRGDMAIVSLAAHQYGAGHMAQQPTTASAPATLTSEQIFEKCSPSVVYVTVYNKKGELTASGSGFFVSSNGVVVTNFHVIDGCATAQIETADTHKTYKVKGVYNYNIDEDWAVLQVDGSGFSPLQIGGDDTIVGGATVYALGSPLGFQNTISEGLISNPARTLGGVDFIQTSAAISHGSSGGALLNKYGQVIGITSASFDDGQNINLALPMRYVDTSSRGTYTVLDKISGTTKTSTENPVDVLRTYLIAKGKTSFLESGEGTLTSYTLDYTANNGYTYSLVYGDINGWMYIVEEYETKFSSVETLLYFYGAGTNEYAAKATYYYTETGTFPLKMSVGFAFVDRETITTESAFEFYSWMGSTSVPQSSAEFQCYKGVLDLIYMADGLFEYFGIPLTMEDFGYVY